MNKKAISILLTAAMGVSVLAAGTVTVSAAEKKDKYVIVQKVFFKHTLVY